MRGSLIFVLAVLAAAFPARAAAADWTRVGICGFVTPDPGIYQNRDWIVVNSIIVDRDGSIWCTANYDTHYVWGTDGQYYFRSGGITCFRTDSTRLDINLAALGFRGAVTKLVEGGDGCIYALQNFTRYQGDGIDGFREFVDHRILRITSGGTVTQIWSPGPVAPGNPANNVIGGMALGGDGNIYWTTNAVDCPGNWKYHFFWRYNTILEIVEECPVTIGTDNGWNEIHRMLNFEYVGDDTFAIVGRMTSDAEWTLTPFKWDMPRVLITENDCNVSAPGWGRHYITAMAYDPVRKAFWAGGRSEVGALADLWYVDGDEGYVIGLGGDNHGFFQFDDSDEGYDNYGMLHQWPEVTLATRFRVDSYDDNAGPIHPIQSSGAGDPQDQVACAIRIENDHFYVYDAVASTHLQYLGPVGPTQWYEASIYIDSNTNTARVYWKDSEVFNGALVPGDQGSGPAGRAEFGASNSDGSGGRSVVTFDWVGVGPGLIYPDAPTENYREYLDGSTLPQDSKKELLSNIMTRWNGGETGTTVFGPQPYTVEGISHWHANGYDEVYDPEPGVHNNGHYWISALAIDPSTGCAWVAWGAEVRYTYDDTARIRTFPPDVAGTFTTLDQGAPEPRAQVIAMTIADGKVYALTVNLSYGAFNVYSADIPYGQTDRSVGQMKTGPEGASVRTDTPKVVTWPEYAVEADHFYIQDDDRSAGIKVVPQDPGDVQAAGSLVEVEGVLGVVDGEAAIVNAQVTSDGGGQAEPVAMPIRSVGGAAVGIQPATDPAYGPSNVCLLVRVTGVGKAYVEDDDSGVVWFTIDDGSGAKTKYLSGGQQIEVDGIKINTDYYIDPQTPTYLTVTGISSVEPQFGNQQVIRVRNSEADIIEITP